MIETERDVKLELYNFIKSIKNDSIRGWTIAMLKVAPSAFWERAASSTGKYHKVDENGAGGQVIHTLRVLSMVEHLVRMDALSEIERDILLSAATLHDVCKYGLDGKTEHTIDEHPRLVEKLRNDNMVLLPQCEHATQILSTVSQHSGRWTVIPVPPATRLGRLLHIADFVASRHNIDIKLS